MQAEQGEDSDHSLSIPTPLILPERMKYGFIYQWLANLMEGSNNHFLNSQSQTTYEVTKVAEHVEKKMWHPAHVKPNCNCDGLKDRCFLKGNANGHKTAARTGKGKGLPLVSRGRAHSPAQAMPHGRV